MTEKTKDVESKGRILKAAKKEFSEKGYSGARMSDIAARAEVNKALIHYYYKNKEALYVEVIKRFFIGNEIHDAPIYSGKWSLTPSQKLYVVVYFIVNTMLKATDPDVVRIAIWELAEGKRFLESIIIENQFAKQRVLLQVIHDGIKSGEFETPFPELSFMNMISFMSFYTVNRAVGMKKEAYEHLYGNADENDIFTFLLSQVFKSLQPAGKELLIPEIPEDLKDLLDRLLTLQIEKKDEGINEEIFRQLHEILLS